jgi:hypothetical protein
MNLTELKGKYARLRDEIDSLGGIGGNSEARRARLLSELDQIDEEYAAVKRRSLTAPTLRDVIDVPESGHQSQYASINGEYQSVV